MRRLLIIEQKWPDGRLPGFIFLLVYNIDCQSQKVLQFLAELGISVLYSITVDKPRPWLHMVSHGDWGLARTAADMLRSCRRTHGSAEPHAAPPTRVYQVPLLHPDRHFKALSITLILRFWLP